jgi:hypothetical protein
MLVQKMDEEDGVSFSNTADMKSSNNETKNEPITESTSKVGVEIDEDGDGVMDGLDYDNDGIIDEYFEHRQCEHVWGDQDNDGELECLKCGKIQDPE